MPKLSLFFEVANMGKFVKKNWRVFVFIPLIMGANLPSILMEGNNDYWYSLGTAISLFILVLWLWIASKRYEPDFSRFVILTGVITAGKGVVDAAIHADTMSSVTEIVFYVLFILIWSRFYAITVKSARSRKRGA